MHDDDLKVGDSVELKSGSPKMTITDVGLESITCMWYITEISDFKACVLPFDAVIRRGDEL